MKINRKLKGLAYETGYKILEDKGVGLVPLCPGNGHFKEKNIKELLDISTKEFNEVYIFIPDNPTEHTYRAMGYRENKARQKAKKQGNNLRNHANRFIPKLLDKERKEPIILDWVNDIASHKDFIKEYKRLLELYKSNKDFQNLVNSETRKVIEIRLKPGMKIEEGISLGIPYVLEELAWLTACPKILGGKNNLDIAYVYHVPWFLDEYISGKYDGKVKENLGFVIIN